MARPVHSEALQQRIAQHLVYTHNVEVGVLLTSEGGTGQVQVGGVNLIQCSYPFGHRGHVFLSSIFFHVTTLQSTPGYVVKRAVTLAAVPLQLVDV